MYLHWDLGILQDLDGALRLAGTLILLLAQLAVFAVALKVVRPRHRTAGTLMVVSALMLAAEPLFWAAYPHHPFPLGFPLHAHYLEVRLVTSLWSAAAWALLLLGVVRLAARVARPAAPQDAPPPDPAR